VEGDSNSQPVGTAFGGWKAYHLRCRSKGVRELSKFSKASSQLHLSGKKCLSPRRNSTRLELSRTNSLKVAVRVPRGGWGVPIL
jgi:hypothetical protein